jgi:RNA polymerase primary sigma factor
MSMLTTRMGRKEELRTQILEKSQKQGIVTYDDILALLPEAEQHVGLLDDIMDDLAEAGIDVVPSTEAEPDEAELSDDTIIEGAASMREGEDLFELEIEEDAMTWFDEDLVKDAGYQQALDSDDVVGLYLKEAGRVPLLTASEEVDLAQRMEAGERARETLETEGEDMPMDDVFDLRGVMNDGEMAQEHLIRANARLVISVAKKYIGRGVPFLDLIQEGNIGLIRATKKFEWRRGHKFSTYATWWIRQAVSRAVADQGRTIRVPVHMGDQLNRMRRVQLQLTQELGREPTIDEIAVGMETTPDKIETAGDCAPSGQSGNAD